MSLYLESAKGLAIVLAPIVGLILLRHRVGPLNTAAALVVYGALFPIGEHAGWTFFYVFGGTDDSGVFWTPHARVHAFMAAVYAVIGLVLLAVVALRLLRTGSRLAWGMLLYAFIAGGSIEVIMNGPAGLLFQHTTPPNTNAGANLLWTYVIAWGVALVISWKPIFQRVPERSSEFSTP